MKRLWAAAILLVLALFLSIYGKFAVEKSIDEICITIENIKNSAESGRDMNGLSAELKEQWEKGQKKLSIWLAHSHVEEVNSQINLINYYIDVGENKDIPECCVQCKVFFDDMRHAQLPYCENVF